MIEQRPHSPNVKARLHGPDVLRGFAALGVMASHVYAISGFPKDPLIGTTVGRFGFLVRLFFAISAFSITYVYCEKIFSRRQLQAFYLKRFFRIAPLFYFMMLVYTALRLLEGRAFPSCYDISMSFFFLFPFVPGMHDSIVGGGWSLGLEWIFYLFIPFMLCLVRGVLSAFIVWLIACLVAVLRSSYFQQGVIDPILLNYGILFFLSHLPFFVAGMGSYFFIKRIGTNRLEKHSFFVGLLIVFLGAATSCYFKFKIDILLAEEIFISLVSFLLIAASVSGIPGWLDNSFTRYLGLISYSIYLTHFVVIKFLSRLGFYSWIAKTIDGTVSGFFIVATGTFFAVFVVASVTYRFIERPAINYGKKFIGNF